ncbi:hypothetical protein [Sporolactobacillus spathodeae]|uniref:MFS family permease n=1 Tax=Sporolactobacillus spathodeae TaxID=1465502 RepID=A0ABS2Q7A9_9BACL|nr:hypothetical protein [Sporolactobacillus spathodeae]MBM7657628.1 MFS family permease [Sporolactobacillus spathodeae]
MFHSWYIALALNIIWLSFLQFFSLLGGLLIAGLLLGSMEQQTNARTIQVFGMKGIYATAWIGTPIHELGHALLCLLFRHQITAIKWFQRPDDHGTIGYVMHRYHPESFYQKTGNLFIGVAPLFSGSLAIMAAAYLLLPPNSRDFFGSLIAFRQTLSLLNPASWLFWLQTFIAMMGALFSPVNFYDLNYWLFLWLSVSIASHMSLSQEDIKGASSGAGLFFLLCLLASFLSYSLDPSLGRQLITGIGRVNFELMLLLSIALIFSFAKWVVMLIIWQIKKCFH